MDFTWKYINQKDRPRNLAKLSDIWWFKYIALLSGGCLVAVFGRWELFCLAPWCSDTSMLWVGPLTTQSDQSRGRINGVCHPLPPPFDITLPHFRKLCIIAFMISCIVMFDMRIFGYSYNGWMGEWIDGWVDGAWVGGWMDWWTDRRIDGWKLEWVEGDWEAKIWTEEWMDCTQWMEESDGGQTNG